LAIKLSLFAQPRVEKGVGISERMASFFLVIPYIQIKIVSMVTPTKGTHLLRRLVFDPSLNKKEKV
jgi:hypothetical protein